MKSAHTLKVYPSISLAFQAIENLEKAFVKAHKRKPRSELTITVISSPFDRSKKRIPTKQDGAEVRIRTAADAPEEVEWFINFIK